MSDTVSAVEYAPQRGPEREAGDPDSPWRPEFAVCVTTMNRVDTLAACLDNLARCEPPAACIVVSDDSPEPATRAANAAVVARHPGVVYLEGPRRGVCANRNNAVRYCVAHASAFEYVSFVDDDIHPAADFFGAARDFLSRLTPAERRTAIITGGATSGPTLHDCHPMRLSFMGYFTASDKPECVNIHAAVFPLELFRHDDWDENIFFGIEDAELSLRALRRGYVIRLMPALRTFDTMPGSGVLHERRAEGGLTRYEVSCEAARLYIGVKRYRSIQPDAMKLGAFVLVYFAHLSVYLVRRRSLPLLVSIVRLSRVMRAVRDRGTA
jgi:glycosyltransferase involved in cell wall biosynthesis